MLARRRVFGIGLRKTGTRSLAAATRALGIRTLHMGGGSSSAPVEAALAGCLPLLHHLGDRYGAYFDVEPLVHRFALVDEQYPGSRFVLSTRHLDDWLDSLERHVLANRVRRDEGGYHGTLLEVDRERWIEEREAHHRVVRAHFADRPDDLLEIDVCGGGHGWEQLAPFLGRPVPSQPFPWENQDGRGTYRLDRSAATLRRRATVLRQRFRPRSS